MNNTLRAIISLPRSLCFNLRHLPLGQAVHLPILVAGNVRTREMRGHINLVGPIRFGAVHLGFHRVHVLDEHSEHTIISMAQGSVWNLHTSAKIGQGTKIIIRPNATLTLNEGFSTSGNPEIVCYKSITIGSGVVSWDTLITDSDSHSIFNGESVRINEDRPVVIEDDVWIGCRCTILKGTHIARGCVVGANSVLCGDYPTENQILAGNPARAIKEIAHFEL